MFGGEGGGARIHLLQVIEPDKFDTKENEAGDVGVGLRCKCLREVALRFIGHFSHRRGIEDTGDALPRAVNEEVPTFR